MLTSFFVNGRLVTTVQWLLLFFAREGYCLALLSESFGRKVKFSVFELFVLQRPVVKSDFLIFMQCWSKFFVYLEKLVRFLLKMRCILIRNC